MAGTGLCAECMLIARNKRLAPGYDDTKQVTHDQVIANVAAVLGGRVISDTPTEGNNAA
jgi:hypothetical protein